jgi:hypothetical protein
MSTTAARKIDLEFFMFIRRWMLHPLLMQLMLNRNLQTLFMIYLPFVVLLLTTAATCAAFINVE